MNLKRQNGLRYLKKKISHHFALNFIGRQVRFVKGRYFARDAYPHHIFQLFLRTLFRIQNEISEISDFRPFSG